MNVSAVARRFAIFLAVGLLSSAVYAGASAILIELLGVGRVPAAGVAFIAGTIVSYVANARATFAAAPSARTLARFFVVTGLGFVLNLALVAVVAAAGWHYVAGILLVLVIVPSFNFAGHTLWTFRSVPA